MNVERVFNGECLMNVESVLWRMFDECIESIMGMFDEYRESIKGNV